MDRQQLVEDWRDGVSAMVGGLEANLAHDGITLDASLESLHGVEWTLLELFGDPEEVLGDEYWPTVTALMGYLGQTLIELTGGSWDWDNQPGFAERAQPPLGDAVLAQQITAGYWGADDDVEDKPARAGIPIAVPPPGLGLTAVSPLHLLLATVAEEPADGTDGPCARTYTAWRANAPEPPSPPSPPQANPVLDEWLAAREQDFPTWADRYPGPWDFTPDSIDALTELVRRQTPTVEDFNDPANTDFVEGASWYLGEMLHRDSPCYWLYRNYDSLVRVGLAEQGDPPTVCYDIKADDGSDFTTPFYLLRLSLRTGQPEARESYDNWCIRYGPRGT